MFRHYSKTYTPPIIRISCFFIIMIKGLSPYHPIPTYIHLPFAASNYSSINSALHTCSQCQFRKGCFKDSENERIMEYQASGVGSGLEFSNKEQWIQVSIGSKVFYIHFRIVISSFWLSYPKFPRKNNVSVQYGSVVLILEI